MKKVKIFFAVLVLFFTVFNAQAIGASTNDISVLINQEKLKTDTPPVFESGRLLVPFRAIAESLGADVAYDSGTITARLNDRKIIMQVGSTIVQVDQTAFFTDVPPMLKKGRTLLPLRLMGELAGYSVSWNGDTNTAHLEKPETQSSKTLESSPLAQAIVNYRKQNEQQLSLYGQVSTWEEYSEPDKVLYYPAGLAATHAIAQRHLDAIFVQDVYYGEIETARKGDKYYYRVVEWDVDQKKPPFKSVSANYPHLSPMTNLHNLGDYKVLHLSEPITQVSYEGSEKISTDLINNEVTMDTYAYTFKLRNLKPGQIQKNFGTLVDYRFKAWISQDTSPKLIKAQYYWVYQDSRGENIYQTVEAYFSDQPDFSDLLKTVPWAQ